MKSFNDSIQTDVRFLEEMLLTLVLSEQGRETIQVGEIE